MSDGIDSKCGTHLLDWNFSKIEFLLSSEIFLKQTLLRVKNVTESILIFIGKMDVAGRNYCGCYQWKFLL